MKAIKNHTTIAIIWWSFAWLSTLLKLRKRLWKNISIKLFDKRDHFCYIPGLHETLLAPKKRLKSLQFSLKKYYWDEFIHEWVEKLEINSLVTDKGEKRTFDYAVIATGSRTNFFNNIDRKKNAVAVRYADDIAWVNQKLQDTSTKTITIIWWGYTGVEVASIIAERKRDDQSVRLIHGWPRLFHRLSEWISTMSEKWLVKHWVDVIVKEKVATVWKSEVTLESWTTYNSDLTIVSAWISLNDELLPPEVTFEKTYNAQQAPHIYSCGDIAVHGLYTTAHNAMMEWRRVWDLIANDIKSIPSSYHPLVNRDKLAIALWSRDGILTNWTKGFYFPFVTWFAKRIIEKRVLIEFKRKILFRI